MEVRHGYFSLEAQNPAGNRLWTLFLAHEKYDHWLRTRNEAQIQEMIQLVPLALIEPGAIFHGLRRDHGEPDGFAYIIRPPYAFHGNGRKRKGSWPGQVFAAFVSPDRVVFQWDWLEADAEDPALPIDWKKRFAGRMQ